MLDSVLNNFFIITDESVSRVINIPNSSPTSNIEGKIQREN